MAAAAARSSTEASRLAWEDYAKQQVSEIRKMSAEERTKSIDDLRLKSALRGLSWEEAKVLFEYPGGMTEKEFKLRAVLQHDIDPISKEELQEHFTYFYRRVSAITGLVAAVTDESRKDQLTCAQKANKVILDEIGKSLIRKGSHPTVPTNSKGK